MSWNRQGYRLKTSSPAVTSLQVDKFMNFFFKDLNWEQSCVILILKTAGSNLLTRRRQLSLASYLSTPLETELSNRRWGLIVNDKNIILCRRGGGQWTYNDGPDQWRGHSWGDCGSKSGGDPRSGPHYHFSLSKVCACALNIFNHYAMILQIAISQQMKFRVPVVGSVGRRCQVNYYSFYTQGQWFPDPRLGHHSLQWYQKGFQGHYRGSTLQQHLTDCRCSLCKKQK